VAADISGAAGNEDWDFAHMAALTLKFAKVAGWSAFFVSLRRAKVPNVHGDAFPGTKLAKLPKMTGDASRGVETGLLPHPPLRHLQRQLRASTIG
jgi:hypothetical protein